MGHIIFYNYIKIRHFDIFHQKQPGSFAGGFQNSTAILNNFIIVIRISFYNIYSAKFKQIQI